MIIILLVATYPFISLRGRFKMNVMAILLVFSGVAVFTYSISQTGGMVLNRYKGEDALGRVKASKFSGREELAATELEMFMDNPIAGVGVGRNKEFREELTGISAASHNEITRMLAEHGFLGVVDLLILIITPLLLYFDNRQHIFLLSFYFFWFLTINHASMRIAAPAFIYSLALLKVIIVEKPPLHRE
jgi:O-antigen ligase